MPRSRSTRSSPMRSSTPSRGMHTAAAAPPPPAAHHAPPAAAQPQQPGLFSQMATTAAGVAVGSAVGHTLANGVSSIFGGGSSEAAQPQQQQYAQAPPQQFQQYSNETTDMCKGNADAFVNCLNSTNNDMSQCQYLLETLNACRAAARNY